MKWPSELVVVRHGESTYNALKAAKQKDPLYLRFKESYEQDWGSERTKRLAEAVQRKFFLGVSEHNTPLTEAGKEQARKTGENLRKEIALPQVIFISTSARTIETFESLKEGWKAGSFLLQQEVLLAESKGRRWYS